MDDIFLQQVVDRLTLGLVYGLITIDCTMVYGIIGMISFTHGRMYMISAYLPAIALALLAFFSLQSSPLLVLGTLLFTVLVTCTCDWMIERIAYKPLRNSTYLTSLISAIGMSLILRNYMQVAQGPRQREVPTLLGGTLKFHVDDGFVQLTYAKLSVLIVSLIGMVMLTYVIRYTKLGHICQTTQQDRKMASVLGIDTGQVISYVFVADAAMVALAGVLITMNYGTFDFYAGFTIDIKAFTVAMLGDIGSLPGAMLGDLVLGVAEAQFSGMVNTDYEDVFAFSLLVLILILRPQGLLGRPQIARV